MCTKYRIVLLFRIDRKVKVILKTFINKSSFNVISESKSEKRSKAKKVTDGRKKKKKENKSCLRIELPVPFSSVA